MELADSIVDWKKEMKDSPIDMYALGTLPSDQSLGLMLIINTGLQLARTADNGTASSCEGGPEAISRSTVIMSDALARDCILARRAEGDIEVAYSVVMQDTGGEKGRPSMQSLVFIDPMWKAKPIAVAYSVITPMQVAAGHAWRGWPAVCESRMIVIIGVPAGHTSWREGSPISRKSLIIVILVTGHLGGGEGRRIPRGAAHLGEEGRPIMQSMSVYAECCGAAASGGEGRRVSRVYVCQPNKNARGASWRGRGQPDITSRVFTDHLMRMLRDTASGGEGRQYASRMFCHLCRSNGACMLAREGPGIAMQYSSACMGTTGLHRREGPAVSRESIPVIVLKCGRPAEASRRYGAHLGEEGQARYHESHVLSIIYLECGALHRGEGRPVSGRNVTLSLCGILSGASHLGGRTVNITNLYSDHFILSNTGLRWRGGPKRCSVASYSGTHAARGQSGAKFVGRIHKNDYSGIGLLKGGGGLQIKFLQSRYPGDVSIGGFRTCRLYACSADPHALSSAGK
ncbi:hypothetical protein FNV43_RR22680 [Rhamnella rubrinervis]|uniref:Uncharacterized protein n=1 Tax=Rhamnella rubrinervis TaxID=2594499 RepID=A0A8K0DX28_9ROSA|nr:hypothetical protein FNV43_RR22680 [Rhamnella rubrinervis]